MKEILCRQLALDYCCSPEEILGGGSVFTEFRPLEGRRRYQEPKECFLKAAAVNGRLLFTGKKEIVAWCRERRGACGSEWFFEPETLRELDARLREDGFQIGMAHPFFIAETPSELCTDGVELRWYRGAEIEAFRGNDSIHRSRYGRLVLYLRLYIGHARKRFDFPAYRAIDFMPLRG